MKKLAYIVIMIVYMLCLVVLGVTTHITETGEVMTVIIPVTFLFAYVIYLMLEKDERYARMEKGRG